MEIVLNKVNYQRELKDISISFHSGLVYGLTGKNSELFGKIISGSVNQYEGEIVSDTKVKSVIVSGLDCFFCTSTVKEEFKFITKINGIKINNIRQAVIEIFYKLDIDESLYDKKITSLSRSQKYLLKIALAVIINPNLIIFNHVFDNLDLKFRKKLKEFINVLKEDKIIIINDSDPNILYDITQYVYVLKNSVIVLEGETNDIYSNVDVLNKLKIGVPYLSDITYKAKKRKDIKLFYRKDVRDTMKDIYRNV